MPFSFARSAIGRAVTRAAASGLLLDGISLILNMGVGMTVLAFYHPWLLAFDFALVMLMALVYLLGRGAISTSITESRCKYAMAAWLEDMARCRTAFRIMRPSRP